MELVATVDEIPPGVVNLVHGGHAAVNALLSDPGVDTSSVFCTVIAVIAVIPWAPQRANALRSAWIPAPPPESEPAIDSSLGGCGTDMTWSVRIWLWTSEGSATGSQRSA